MHLYRFAGVPLDAHSAVTDPRFRKIQAHRLLHRLINITAGIDAQIFRLDIYSDKVHCILRRQQAITPTRRSIDASTWILFAKFTVQHATYYVLRNAAGKWPFSIGLMDRLSTPSPRLLAFSSARTFFQSAASQPWRSRTPLKSERLLASKIWVNIESSGIRTSRTQQVYYRKRGIFQTDCARSTWTRFR